MKPGTEQGKSLTLADKRAIRAELVHVARTTDARSFTFRWDDDQMVEFRAFPDGKCVESKVTDAGISVEPQRGLTRAGVPARVAWAVGAGVAVVAAVVERLV